MRLSTHVLDTAKGLPANGVAVTLHRDDGDWVAVASGVTGDDGRLGDWVDPGVWRPGRYRLSFDVSRHTGEASLFSVVNVDFQLNFDTAVPRDLHLPLLISPFGYTTYRGS